MANKDQTTDPSQDEKNRREELATTRFHFLIAMLILIVFFTIGSLILIIAMPSEEDVEKGGLFSVETIVLEGNTQYAEQTVLAESRIVIGQSIFSLKSNEVEARLLEIFPYYTTVDVQTVGMNQVNIKVEETTAIGVIYDNGSWVTVGKNGKAIDREPITSDMPKGRLFLKGAVSPQEKLAIGDKAMDDYSLTVCQTLIDAINEYKVTDIVEIDMTNQTNIRLDWRGQIDIHLGNASNLEHEVGVVAAALPKILDARGQQATGILDLTSYSNEALENKAVFTPSSLLNASSIVGKTNE